jgi:uncharacterized protein YjiS (DUF1127 family)
MDENRCSAPIEAASRQPHRALAVARNRIAALQHRDFSHARASPILRPETRATTAADGDDAPHPQAARSCTMAAQAITSQDINALAGRTRPALESGVPSVLALVRRLVAWYERDRKCRETVAELSRLSDHVLADVGIGRHEILEIARNLSRKTA